MSNLVINLSANDITEQSSYEPLPAGNYVTSVFNVELTEVKSGENAGKPQYKVQLKVQDGQFENRRLFTYLPLYSGKAFWKSQAFFEALGYEMSAGNFTVPTPNELAGKQIVAKVKVVPDQNGGQENNVSGFTVPTAQRQVVTGGATPVANASAIWGAQTTTSDTF